jgi:hypothetical protein
MKKAEVINVDWANQDRRQIKVTINAQDSVYIQEPNGHGFPQIMNSGPMIEGFNHVLEFGHEAVNAMKGNENFMELATEVRELRKGILNSDLASRVRELLICTRL